MTRYYKWIILTSENSPFPFRRKPLWVRPSSEILSLVCLVFLRPEASSRGRVTCYFWLYLTRTGFFVSTKFRFPVDVPKGKGLRPKWLQFLKVQRLHRQTECILTAPHTVPPSRSCTSHRALVFLLSGSRRINTHINGFSVPGSPRFKTR